MDYATDEDPMLEKEEPTFEDLAIDDTLSDLDRVTKYICSNIALQRVIHVKMLGDTARSVGFAATCDHLVPLLEPLVCDVEYVVRQHVALQFPPMCEFIVKQGDDAGYRVLLDKMIPLLMQLVSDKQYEVRSAANDSLVELAALVKPEDQGAHILTIVLPLAHDDDNEQFRISAATLYHGLAEHLGPELCQQFCVPELISLSEDPVFRVRKSTAQSFASVCMTAGQEITRERLLPSFQRLVHDDVWAVRKACAECLVNISEALAPADRGDLLIPLLETCLNDPSRWVRLAAFQSLGPFLATLQRDAISDDLLRHFIAMGAVTQSSGLHGGGGSDEVDMKFHCAFNFPALVSLLGQREWHELAPTFDALSQDPFWKIRRTFAYSLHELARMLGTEITEAQLATAFDTYLRDVPDVRLGAMLHFSDFLENVSPSFRESYLPVLTELLQSLVLDQTKWRVREIITRQLPQLCRIFPEEATFSVIYPLVVQLVTDEVAVVRQQSVHACPLLVARIAGRADWMESIVEKLLTLSKSGCFTDRQVFLRICGAFLSFKGDDSNSGFDGPAFFTNYLAPAFFALVSDPVANVRLVCMEELVAHKDALLSAPSCPDALAETLRAEGTWQTIEDLFGLLQVCLPPPVKDEKQPTTDGVAVEENATEAVEAGEVVEAGEAVEAGQVVEAPVEDTEEKVESPAVESTEEEAAKEVSEAESAVETTSEDAPAAPVEDAAMEDTPAEVEVVDSEATPETDASVAEDKTDVPSSTEDAPVAAEAETVELAAVHVQVEAEAAVVDA
ncbi:hypothetical protein Poli38472_012901 [Pythium oligandrum]|uniref:Serine/threonine-protein phosphatase 4 regulatory subunit 1 n=1 Tax=Pythium oligandrum TaxID=41045 RepID=A0A8K1CJM8_PYTOL|nr:hypothetical protein Poli38472_012901 [Pythium oligandrum]|eukprot:TMW64279.1 hypothetical protein Poli38472_012901 [Pythium oligandrum]